MGYFANFHLEGFEVEPDHSIGFRANEVFNRDFLGECGSGTAQQQDGEEKQTC
jgi:hypothetical protein